MNSTNHWRCYSAPGRVCLYGEHQDYLGLRVIPAAINLRTIIAVKRNHPQEFQVHSDNLSTSEAFPLEESLSYTEGVFDYLKAVINVLFQKGLGKKLSGLNVKIFSSVPIGSGLSSSAALLVAWVYALNEEFNFDLSAKEIAQIAYLAEHDELKINCGIMDQYASSLGGLFSLECSGPPYTITPFPHEIEGLVIGDSLVRREANKPLTLLKKQLLSGMEKINSKTTTSFHTLNQKELDNHKAILSDEEYLRLSGAIGIRDITTKTFEHLQTQKNYDPIFLGENLTKQQTYLREYLQVSIPKLDHLVRAAHSAGALGAKLTGAGLGGCIVAYAPNKEQEVAEAIARNGGKAIYCKTDTGARKEEDCLH